MILRVFFVVVVFIVTGVKCDVMILTFTGERIEHFCELSYLNCFFLFSLLLLSTLNFNL